MFVPPEQFRVGRKVLLSLVKELPEETNFTVYFCGAENELYTYDDDFMLKKSEDVL